MDTCATRLRVPALCVILAAAALVLPGRIAVEAGNPHGAYYTSDSDKVFWFLHVSDPHIGASGSTDSARLTWIVTTARSVINPQFVVATGDLTDSTNGNIFGYPDGPHQEEWNEYRSILAAAGAGPDFYYDIPGNHDAYNDATFAFYRANSVQGRATGGTQVSWTRRFSFGVYHFLGVNTAGNNGAPFSIFRPWGDYAGLDSTEMAFINQKLAENSDAALTLVFGHHPVTDTGASDDTWIGEGHQEFIQTLDVNGASAYDYGHTHDSSQALFKGDAYTGLTHGDGIHYYNVASLGKSGSANYSLVAIDGNAISTVMPTTGTWPVVIITAPVDRYLGGAVNPYAYSVPNSVSNPIRALVFDAGAVSQVSYRIDGAATWQPMNRVDGNPALWSTTWNASAVAAGDHTLEVRAVGSTTMSDLITVNVTASGNRPPVALNDSYSTAEGVTLTVAVPGVLANDTDPDGNTLTAALVSGPEHGSLTLNSDGSFWYAPATGYSGADSFTYAAHDGIVPSIAATVVISIAQATKDTVGIVSATYARKTKRLTVEATSSAQPNAVLTVSPGGQMTFKPKSKMYVYQGTVATAPGSVTVTSSLGGSATSGVNVK